MTLAPTMDANPEKEWVVSSLLINAGVLARSNGISWTALLERHGVSSTLLAWPNTHISLLQTLHVFNELSRITANPTLFLNGFAHLPIGAADLFDYVAIFAPNTKTAAHNWVHYAPLCSSCLDLHLALKPEGLVLDLFIPPRVGSSIQITYALMGLIASRLAHILGPNSRYVQMEIKVMDPSSDSHPLDLNGFDGPIAFEAPRNRFVIPARLSELPNPQADRNLMRLIETATSKLLHDQHQETSALSMIAKTIAEGLRTGQYGVDHISSSLCISQRSLQRMLEQEGTNYREMLEKVRRATAEGYLLDTRMPIKEIAYLLGFSNISAFSRAVKNWFGVSPRDLRKQATDAQGQPPPTESE